MLYFVLLGVSFLAAAVEGANFSGPSIQQITPPVDHAEGPTWDGRKNILYFVDIHYGGVLAYHYDTNKLTRVTLNGEVSPVVPSRKDPNILLVGLNRSVVAIEWDGNLALGGQQVLATVSKDHPTSRFNDGKADKQGRLWWGTIGYESPTGDLNMYEAYFYKITKENLDNPTIVKAPVSNSNGLAWNKANNKLYYIDTPTRKIVEFVYDDDLGVLSKENRTAFDVDLYPGKITGYPDGMTIDEDDNLWICLYGGGSVIKANPTTGELLKVVPIPARDVTSAMWGGPDLDILFVTTSKHSLSDTEKVQQPGAGSVYAITNLGTKGLPVFTADIIDSIAKRRPSGGQ
ncbi:regucalcin isoform X2 [Anoplophora glabripennis]|uniref:Regucalcin n=1 Tax=Anoplophora glabripennis TaxID=217634 RepID=V5GNF0_ANOGL|nr:regucalcin isoform X2 [Anoplophora glabripennis]